MHPIRLSQWNTHKATILESLLVQKQSYSATRDSMLEEYAFEADIEEYHAVMRVWTAQEQIHEHRRKSLEDEGNAVLKSRAIDDSDDKALLGATSSATRRVESGTNLSQNPWHDDAADTPSSSSSQPPPLSPTTPSAAPDLIDRSSPEPPEAPATESELDDLASLYLSISHLTDEPQNANEEPPPYSADGWEWPGEENGELNLQDYEVGTE
jgi:hypothetical protein